MALFSKQTAWDKIKAAVADAAEQAGDAAGGGWEATKTGASATGSAIGTGASAVGRGVSAGASAVEHKVESVANGVVAGAIAGALASWVMHQFQMNSAKVAGGGAATASAQSAQDAGGTAKSASAEGTDGNATVKVAEQISTRLGHDLKPEEKAAAGQAVHYGYGAAMGALYGGLTELVPAVGIGLGLPYATAMWLFGDEIATSALGLSKPPEATSPQEHASSLSSHFVYGVTLDISRRVLRHIV